MTTVQEALASNSYYGIYIGDNRYGGGCVASMLVVGELDPIDTVFTGSDNEHGLGTSLLNTLGIPYFVDDTLSKPVWQHILYLIKPTQNFLTNRNQNAYHHPCNRTRTPQCTCVRIGARQ